MLLDTKKCSKCKKELPLTAEYFYRDNKVKTGFASACKECKKKWAADNKEKIAEYQKKYSEENSERLKEYYKEYHQNNKEKRSKQQKEYRFKKIEAIKERERLRSLDPEYKEKRRKYRLTRKDRDKFLYNEWRKNNTERISTIKQARYNRIKNLPCEMNHDDWLEALSDFNNECAYCGESNVELTREHFIPVIDGGGFTKDNIIPACRSCNSSKQDTDFFEWYPLRPYYSEERRDFILNYITMYQNYDTSIMKQGVII